MSRRRTFPALRMQHAANGFYYVTFFKFADVDAWIRSTDEIHKRKELATWIQRRLETTHARRIAEYLSKDERFFGAIVVGLYGGKPHWGELGISDPFNELTDVEEVELAESIGFVRMSGRGEVVRYRRVSIVSPGIKKAVREGYGERVRRSCGNTARTRNVLPKVWLGLAAYSLLSIRLLESCREQT